MSWNHSGSRIPNEPVILCRNNKSRPPPDLKERIGPQCLMLASLWRLYRNSGATVPLHSLATGYDDSDDDEVLITIIIVSYNEPNIKPGAQVLAPLNGYLVGGLSEADSANC